MSPFILVLFVLGAVGFTAFGYAYGYLIGWRAGVAAARSDFEQGIWRNE